MPRRGENIFKRKDGRWEARFLINRDSSGKAKYRSVYARTYTEVKEKRRNMQETYVDSCKKPDCTYVFREILEKWLREKDGRLKEQTVQKYCYCMEKHIIPVLGNIPMKELSTEIIHQFLQEKMRCGGNCGKPLSPNYVRTMAVIISSAHDYAVKEGFCSPFYDKLQKPREEKKEIIILKHREQKELEQEAKRHLSGAGLAVYLSLHTGLRIGEVCALSWNDIDFEEGFLYVNSSVVRKNIQNHSKYEIAQPKTTKSRRMIPLTEQLVAVLEEEKRKSSSFFVISSGKEGTFMHPRTLENRYKAMLKKCEIPEVPYHTLRHTFATRCIECGMDVKALSEVLGHSRVNITLDTYVHPSIRAKREGILRLETIFCQNSGH